MTPDQMEEPQKIPQKMSFFRKVLIFIGLVALLFLLLFVFLKTRESTVPPSLPQNMTQVTYTDVNSSTTTIVPTEEDSTSIMFIVGLFFLIGGIAIATYFFMTQKKSGLLKKEYVEVDRAFELFCEHFSLNNGIPCIYDTHKSLYIPTEREHVVVTNKIPYYHTATADKFCLLEIEVCRGRLQGVHTVIIPIDRGEKAIRTGEYRLDTQTPKFQFQLSRINFPMSSLTEKQDRMRFAMLEQADPEQIPSMMKELGSTPHISTPMDTLHEQQQGFGEQPYVSPPRYRRPYHRPYHRRSHWRQ